MFRTIFDLALVIIGFGAIVFVHELGHFLAARWAGIRVLSFAMGFGPALLTFRKGLGLRKGSSEGEYLRLARGSSNVEGGHPVTPLAGVSATEYRFNALPFGGYVRMLGQDDADPTATSNAPDAYQQCPPWKRMIVISAGVVMNIISAAILFVVVMMVGMQVNAPVVGDVVPGSPAEHASATVPTAMKGLLPGDRILACDSEEVSTFDDIHVSIAMSSPGASRDLLVARGDQPPVHMDVKPAEDPKTGFLSIGIEPAMSLTVVDGRNDGERTEWTKVLQVRGLSEFVPGSTIKQVAGVPVRYEHDLRRVLQASGGKPVEAVLAVPTRAPAAAADGKSTTVERTITLTPEQELQRSSVTIESNTVINVEHVLGFAGVMSVRKAKEGATAAGLRDGDVFARLGSAEFPSVASGVRELRGHKNSTLPVVVLRKIATGSGDGWEEVSLPSVHVTADGTIGFDYATTSMDSAWLASPIANVADAQGKESTTPAGVLGLPPGTTIVSVGGLPVRTLGDVVVELRRATLRSQGGSTGADVTLEVQRPLQGMPSASAPKESVTLKLSAEDVRVVHALGWTHPVISMGLLVPAMEELRTASPMDALRMGLRQTRSMMARTYLTFVRIAQGTVKVKELKGPVGIAHMGTIIADRGFIWLLFFLAIISVNLAVINFLPLPIVDGGQFLFLIYEAIRGKPVPVRVQNAVMLAGLVLIVGMFLFVTYHDIRRLFGM